MGHFVLCTMSMLIHVYTTVLHGLFFLLEVAKNLDSIYAVVFTKNQAAAVFANEKKYGKECNKLIYKIYINICVESLCPLMRLWFVDKYR